MSDRSRRNALSNDEAMADAESMCLPCKLCGGKAKISDAGPGWGYYIRCENADKKCLVGETRRSGWAYNVMELWNKAMAPAAEITRLQKALDTAREARVTDVDLIKRLVIPMVQERSREPGDAWAQAASALAALQKKEATE